MLQSVKRHLGRAFAWDLGAIRLADSEKARLEKNGVTEPVLQNYAAWRRSILLMAVVPTLLGAVLATTDTFTDGTAGLSQTGRLLTLVSTAVLWAMPFSALIAALQWARPRRSHRLLLVGWIAAFVPPFVLALVPMNWWFEVTGSPEEQAGQRFGLAVLDVVQGLYFYCTLMPAALSLLPGLIRACLRVKTLLPAAIVPGWFLVAGAPFSMLLWLVALVALNHLAGNLFLIAGVLLWIGSPLVYLVRANLFVRPISAAECRQLGPLQWLVKGLTILAVGLLTAYVLTKKVFGLNLIGWEQETALVWLWQNSVSGQLNPFVALPRATSIVWAGDLDVSQLVIEYASRSLFLTVVFADLLVRMNLSVWRHERTFSQTKEAAAAEQTLEEMDRHFGSPLSPAP